MHKTFLVCDLQGSGFHIFVNVLVEGVRCRFLIDTGASRTVIDKHFFETKLGRKMKVIRQETTGLHSTVMESYRGNLKSFSIGPKELKKVDVAGIDLTHVNGTYKKLKQPKIQGILGSDLMLKYKMILDYGQQKIHL